MSRSITINKFNYKEHSEEEWFEMQKAVRKCREGIRDLSDEWKDRLKDFENAIDKEYEDYSLQLDALYCKYKSLIGSCWVMCDKDTDEAIAFICPYMVSEINGYLFTLYSEIGGNVYGSLEDKSLEMINLSERNLVFHEVSEDVLLDNAMSNCKNMLKKRIKNKDIF